jgi:hypothetical protein
MVELDIAKLQAAAAELGYWPATTDDEHLEKLRADNERFDRMNAHDPYHTPCPVCGRPTRFKQWPTRCLCNRGCSKAELEKREHHRSTNPDHLIPSTSPSGPPLRIADRYATGRPRAPRRD